ncbi:MAG TPA: glycosyltransferase family 87 protein [Ktedonobacteraceae bacterium]|nr:glycosyltransferase family 87 protein [Ktedonobacteraceae bacterium]
MIPKSVETTRSAEKVEKRAGKALGERFWHAVQDKYLLLLLLLAAVLFCEAAWLAFLTPTEADIVHYECYGLTFWLGSHGAALLPQAQCAFIFQHISPFQPALHLLPLEYPSLTLLPFSLPLLIPLPYYALSFILLMTLAAALIYWLLARSGAWLAAPIFLFYLVLGTAGVAQERFDLLPAACTLICLLAAERGRWRTAYIALALGVLLKLYPIVMLPALFFAEQRAWLMQQEYVAAQGSWLTWAWESAKRWRWRNCLLCVGLLIAVMGGFALLNVQDAIVGPLQYFLVRPPQIESLASSAIWASSSFGAHYTINFDYGSLNLIKSELSSVISPVDTLLTITGILFVFWLQWRKRIDLAQAMVGLVCVLITTGKVFSPQYLIWLIPLLAYLYARGKTSRPWMYCWAAISLLTTVIYVCYYTHLTDPLTDAQILPTLPGFFQLVALRNLLLLGATVAFLCNWWGARSTNKQGDHLG